MRKNIFWDLDGTLTDPKLGILRCIQYALRVAGHTVPPMDDLLWCIGPPLHVSFPVLVPGISETQVWELVALYRERFADVGLYENAVYPGIAEILAELSSTKQLYVATSKPQVFAEKIITHFN